MENIYICILIINNINLIIIMIFSNSKYDKFKSLYLFRLKIWKMKL